jgi:hypothetical protein
MFELILDSEVMINTFSQYSHHYNCSIIFTTQNYFAPSKQKTIVRQCNYKVFFNDRADQILIRNISCQITPTRPQFLSQCFKNLEQFFPNENYLYILIDSSKQSLLKKLPFRSKIFPDSDGIIRQVCFFPDDY